MAIKRDKLKELKMPRAEAAPVDELELELDDVADEPDADMEPEAPMGLTEFSDEELLNEIKNRGYDVADEEAVDMESDEADVEPELM